MGFLIAGSKVRWAQALAVISAFMVCPTRARLRAGMCPGCKCHVKDSTISSPVVCELCVLACEHLQQLIVFYSMEIFFFFFFFFLILLVIFSLFTCEAVAHYNTPVFLLNRLVTCENAPLANTSLACSLLANTQLTIWTIHLLWA